MKSGKQKLLNLIISASAFAAMWLIWLAARFAVGDEYVVPSVSATVGELFALAGSPAFWSAFGMTFLRSLCAWLISLVSAAALASLCIFFPAVRRFFAPFVAVFRTVPTMAITLMLLIWSSPKVAPLVVAVLMVFPLAFNQFLAAFDGIDRALVRMLAVYRVPFGKRLFRVYVPQVLPPVLSQAGPDFSLTLKVIVSAEVLCSTFDSLGGLIYQSNVFLDTAQMFALTICALAAGGVSEWALSKLVRLTDAWTGRGEGRTRVRAAGVPRCRMLAVCGRYRYGAKFRRRPRGAVRRRAK